MLQFEYDSKESTIIEEKHFHFNEVTVAWLEGKYETSNFFYSIVAKYSMAAYARE